MLIEKFRPATFTERGVALPLTTPVLLGLRARQHYRDGLELILPNPSGVGVFIFDWRGIGRYCQVSLHDRELIERVASLPVLMPAAIRELAREVAQGGWAGQDAAEAAGRNRAAEQHVLLTTNFCLLVYLLKQVETLVPGLVPPEQEQPEQEQPERLKHRAKRTIDGIAPQLGMSADDLGDILEALAKVFMTVGVGDLAPQALLPRQLKEIRNFLEELRLWAAQAGSGMATVARGIMAEGAATAILAERVITANQQRAANVVQLIKEHRASAAKLTEEIASADWVLDGWSLICNRWRAASPEEREEVVEELGAMMPPVPKQAEEWGYAYRRPEDGSFSRKTCGRHKLRAGIKALSAAERGETTIRLLLEDSAA